MPHLPPNSFPRNDGYNEELESFKQLVSDRSENQMQIKYSMSRAPDSPINPRQMYKVKLTLSWPGGSQDFGDSYPNEEVVVERIIEMAKKHIVKINPLFEID